MKLIKTIAALAFAFWTIQLLLFVLLFASAITHLIVQGFIFLGLKTPRSSIEQFLISVLKILTWPARLLVAKDSFGQTPLATLWATGLNSLIWAVPLGALWFYARSRRSQPPPSDGQR